MFFTRSIRRKLVFGLALVLVMLTTLSLSGISGLLSYRNVVRDLEFSLDETPNKTDLVFSIGNLWGPLVNTHVQNRSVIAAYSGFSQRLQRARTQLDVYWQKLVNLPPTPGTRRRTLIAEQLLAEITLRLEELEADAKGLNDAQRRGPISTKMLQTILRVKATALQLPNLQEGLPQTLRVARQVYRSRILLVSITSTIVVVLFFSLIAFGYRWIFTPIRILHQGASRVAQGDFDYRVRLSTNDEMAELAESFNKMTERFQEIAGDLDRQVRERSKQLVRSERLAGVGFLAAGLAHEINNPLTAIKWTSESLVERIEPLLLRSDENDKEVVRKYLQMIGEEASRCQQITARLLDFSRGQDATRERNNLTAIVSEVVTLVSHMSKFRDRNVSFQTQDPCYLEFNGPEIKQVALNLVANALESMDRDGVLEIEILEQTDHVVVKFTDDGCGMESDVIENLFEPFFTQNKTGRGTGLGLSISHRIVSEHGGTIEVHSDGTGCGSTFYVRLPRKASREEAAA